MIKAASAGELKANDVTDDARPEIIGKAKAGSTVTIMMATWCWAASRPMPVATGYLRLPPAIWGDGVRNITAIAKDLTEVTRIPPAPSASKLIVSTEPSEYRLRGKIRWERSRTILNSNDVTDDPQPILHGTAEAGSTVNIYTVDGTLLGSSHREQQRAWNFKPGSKLPEGKNTFYVTATDEAGRRA
ncbi:hypothetical protein KIF59_23130 [Enterobacter cloacae subsp. cloacae]|nr:hypothetical protein [Enterobacter cloacae subsp. cloacae]